MIDIDISSNFLDVADAIEFIKGDVLEKASRHAINRTLLSLRKESISRIQEKAKIKSTALRERHIALTKASGAFPGGMHGIISFNTNPVPLLEFVRGSKEPVKQKGIPVRKRRALRVEIVPGKVFAVKSAFIQRVMTKQVFKRVPKGEDFKKQGTRSVGFIVMERGIAGHLVSYGATRFRELFYRDFQARMSGAISKVREPRKGR